MADDDEALTEVLGRLSGEQRERIEERFTAANRHWTGAEAGDILAALHDHDAHLDVLEPFYEQHEEVEPGPAPSYAILALIWLGRPVTEEAVRELAGL